MKENVISLQEAVSALEGIDPVHRETGAHQSEADRWEQDPEHQRTIAFYRSHIQAHPDASVLDLGAGAGKVSIHLTLVANVASVIAYDMSLGAMRPLIESARQRIKKTPQLEKISFSFDGRPWSLPFDRECFDVIVCRYSMHHFADQPNTVQEMYRCLKPGGLLLYSDPAMPEHSRSTTQGLYMLREDNFHGYRTYHEMIDLLTDKGLLILGVRPYDYQRGTLDDYLKAADPALKEHLIRAWCSLDDKTKRELKWSGYREGPFITYSIVDIAAHKLDDQTDERSVR
jgi:SAM-dependent methyltransferase